MKKLIAILTLICLLALSTAIAEEVQFTDATAIEAPIDEIELELGDDIEDIVPEEVTEIDLGEELLSDIGGLTAPSDIQADAVASDSDVAIDETNFPDEHFREYVRESFDTDGDGMLSEAVTEIYVPGREITSLEGVRLFANLQELSCLVNQLTDLDVSGCARLSSLYCNQNRLTSLNLDGCSNLWSLNCGSNRLTNLDVSQFPKLHSLNCGVNELTDLDLSSCTELSSLNCEVNKLTKLDLSSCTELWSLDCGGNQLTRLDVSGCGALEELICEQNSMTKLDMGDHKWLSSLKCAENALTHLDLSGCPALEYLECYSNQLSALIVKGYQALRYLNCDDNALKTLDVDGCTALVFLYCDQNQLEDLDVSACKHLKGLSCRENRLTRLCVRGCAELESLSCDVNKLTDLDLGGCATLETLFCYQNRLTSLALGDCVALEWLYCDRNQLTALDVSDNAELSLLVCYGNSIPSLDITHCSEIRRTWKNPKKTTRDGYKIIYAGEPHEFFGSYGIEIDRATALIINGKPVHGKLSLSDAVITVPDQTYTGKALKPAVTVKYGTAKLKAGTDYTVSYKNNKKIGAATVIVNGKGSYVGEKTASFNIVPKAVTGLKLKAGKKQMTVSWKKVSGITGYQLEYSLKKNFSSPKQVSVSKAATVKKTLKNLKKGKTYYVRIRAYKDINGQTYWSAWSASKKAKVK